MKTLSIANQNFKNRLFIGTGKFSSYKIMKKAIIASKTELVTVSLSRIDFSKSEDDLLSSIPENVKIVVNTAGARNAKEAIMIAKIAKESGYNWIKLEIHPDRRTLLPDPIETFKAAEEMIKMGCVVMPYINADPVLCKKLEDIGVQCVMPLGSLIGSNQGLKTEYMLKIIIEQSNVPVIIDAGIGSPTDAAAAIELGADAVLVNTAIASAQDPVMMAEAFYLAVLAAEKALFAGCVGKSNYAVPTSPLSF